MTTFLFIVLMAWVGIASSWFFETFNDHERFFDNIPTWPKKLLYAGLMFLIGGPGIWIITIIMVMGALIIIPTIAAIVWLHNKLQENFLGKLKTWFLK